ncbi:hypothetical protein WJ24_26825 [Burkholderia vietnamiensis]|uniref:hypothetical protein n=1 Tax=Burkholderia vietnamiensis TaxID=60552 RepID=UPI0007592AA6|nr:hypothetical protein [Burkholderia vietnamiensis]KVG05591.1 hypothetical protein WJ24_26825 [Burkholderia vietnamiensis]HDR9204591.1 hypothetical protein [Burkholderia vietnamiensis]HDR9258758.1 hypothetical protein [Burkholderia vietnamiensis]
MISRTTLDQLTEVLRSELDKKARTRSGAAGATPAGSTTPKNGPRSLGETLPAHIDQLLAAGVTDEFQLMRAAVEHVLHRQFGDEQVNDPTFQSIANRVTQAILEDGNLKDDLMTAFARRK